MIYGDKKIKYKKNIKKKSNCIENLIIIDKDF